MKCFVKKIKFVDFIGECRGPTPPVEPMTISFSTGNYIPSANISFVPEWFVGDDFTIEWPDGYIASFTWDGSGWSIGSFGQYPITADGSGAMLTQEDNSISLDWVNAEVFMPSYFPNLVLWLDAADTSTLWADTSGTIPATTTIAKWDDKSGNDNHAIQETSASRPTTGTTTINGRNAVSFAVSNNQNIHLPSSLHTIPSSANTFFSAFKRNEGANNLGRILSTNTDSVGEPYTASFTSTTFDVNNRNATVSNVVGNISAGVSYIGGFSFNGTDLIYPFLNGVASLPAVGSPVTVVNMIIGNRLTGNRSLNGLSMEILIYSEELSTSQKNKVNSYLSNKWDISVERIDDDYDVMLLVGQSNAIGRYGPIDPDIDQVNPNVFQLKKSNSMVSVASNPLDHWDETSNTVGFGLTLGKMQYESSGRKVLLVPAAMGGSSFGSGAWQEAGALREYAIEAANRAMSFGTGNNRFVGIFWMQGESDRTLSENDYSEYIDEMIDDYRNRIEGADNCPFIAASIPTWSTQFGLGVDSSIKSLPDRVENTTWLETSDLVSGGDSLHLSAASQRTLGQRFFASLSIIV